MESGNRRPTVGFLLASIHKGSSAWLWPGVADEAAANDTNLFCFPGGALNAADGYEIQRNAVYRLAGPESLDGILSWASSLGGAVDAQALTAFHQPFLGMPLVTLSYPLAGVPAVMVDAYRGMQELLDHFIKVHDYRSIAFIRGPETHVMARERFQAYVDILSRCGLERRDELVSDPFPWDGGEAAMRQLLDERGLAPGRDFRALVAASDLQIFGAVKSLQRRGFRIPEEVAAGGFNDIAESRLLSPPITTVAMPFREQGVQAFRLLASLIRSREAAESVTLTTRLILRESCGCPSRRILLAKGGEGDEGEPAEGIEALTEAFFHDARAGSPPRFLTALHEIMERIIAHEGEIAPWQDVISSLRRRAFTIHPALDRTRLEDLCSQGRVMICEAVDRGRILRAWLSDQKDRQLRDLGRQLLMTLDFDRLGDMLREQLPSLGIPSAYICLYEDSWDHPERARLIIGFTEAGWAIDRSAPPVFPVRELLPRRYLPASRRYSYVVLPLFHQDQQLGYAVLEVLFAEGTLYEELRTYLSSALKGALLFAQARQAREAAEKADQLKSRLLANVSHELRAPLAAILRHASTALRRHRADGGGLPPGLREDLYHIQNNAEHQLRVTNDLLELSRAEIEKLDLSVKAIDPRPLLLEEFAAHEASRVPGSGVRWEIRLPPRLPFLMADEARFSQIIGRLLDNAAKFTKNGGILLAAEVEPPYLHITVRDSGPGMSDRQQERIFEPLVSVLADPQGRRGIGLGLPLVRNLVALHSGRLDLESALGKGSTFHVRLPLPNLSGPLLPYPENPAPLILFISQGHEPAGEVLMMAEACSCSLKRLLSEAGWEEDLGGRSPAALVWDMEKASPGDWALIRNLRHHPLLFEAPFLLYGRNPEAESGSLLSVINAACPAPSTGPVYILSEDQDFRELFSGIVEKGLEGFSLRCLSDPEEGLRFMAQEPPSLLIMEYKIAGLSAPELIDRLRRDTRLQTVPVLLLHDGILEPKEVSGLEGFAGVTLLNSGVLSAAETHNLASRMLFAEKGSCPGTAALVKRVVGYFNRYFRRPVSRWKLAEAVNASEDYLTRVFRREMGISPWEYLSRFRVRRAAVLLRQSEESVRSIAKESGFQDQAYFSRVFRKTMGISPLEYRKKASRDILV